MLPSGLPDEIDDAEDIARFLTSSSQFNTTSVKLAAFMPSPSHQETSVSRHGRAPIDTLKELGLSAAGERSLYGAAVLAAKVIRSTGLTLLADEPPPRHAVIRGWPTHDDPDLQKAKQKEAAMALASACGAPVRLT